jgi:hypothetical protein
VPEELAMVDDPLIDQLVDDLSSSGVVDGPFREDRELVRCELAERASLPSLEQWIEDWSREHLEG